MTSMQGDRLLVKSIARMQSELTRQNNGILTQSIPDVLVALLFLSTKCPHHSGQTQGFLSHLRQELAQIMR